MSEHVTTSKVALMLLPHSVDKSSPEGILPYQTRHRKLVPENGIWYQLHSGLSCLTPTVTKRSDLSTMFAFMPIGMVDKKIIQGILYTVPEERSTLAEHF